MKKGWQLNFWSGVKRRVPPKVMPEGATIKVKAIKDVYGENPRQRPFTRAMTESEWKTIRSEKAAEVYGKAREDFPKVAEKAKEQYERKHKKYIERGAEIEEKYEERQLRADERYLMRSHNNAIAYYTRKLAKAPYAKDYMLPAAARSRDHVKIDRGKTRIDRGRVVATSLRDRGKVIDSTLYGRGKVFWGRR